MHFSIENVPSIIYACMVCTLLMVHCLLRVRGVNVVTKQLYISYLFIYISEHGEIHTYWTVSSNSLNVNIGLSVPLHSFKLNYTRRVPIDPGIHSK